MHHIYKTKAVVLSSSDFKEADKQLILLTEDFGLIKVTAQGTRKIESKLRPSIQDFSLTNVALVKGKAGWRLTNAQIEYSIKTRISNQKLFKAISRTFSLIERFVLGESEDDLFFIVFKFLDFALENQKELLHEDQIKNFESIFVYEIMILLGYIGDQKKEVYLFDSLGIEKINSIDQKQRQEINKIINQSIRESGL